MRAGADFFWEWVARIRLRWVAIGEFLLQTALETKFNMWLQAAIDTSHYVVGHCVARAYNTRNDGGRTNETSDVKVDATFHGFVAEVRFGFLGGNGGRKVVGANLRSGPVG
jgi:hypothetical protein